MKAPLGTREERPGEEEPSAVKVGVWQESKIVKVAPAPVMMTAWVVQHLMVRESQTNLLRALEQGTVRQVASSEQVKHMPVRTAVRRLSWIRALEGP